MRIPRRWLRPDERVLAAFRPHWHVLIRHLLLAMLLAAGGGMAFAALDDPLRLMVIAGLATAWCLVSVRPLLRRMFSRYVLTDQRLLARFGMVARSGTEVPLTHIANIEFSQTILQRMLGYGTVVLSLLGDREDVVLRDVPAPAQFEAAVWAARAPQHDAASDAE